MKTLSAFPIVALSAALAVLADPATIHHELTERASGFQSVDLSFQAGPVSYNLTIPADGKEYFTGKPSKWLFPRANKGHCKINKNKRRIERGNVHLCSPL